MATTEPRVDAAVLQAARVDLAVLLRAAAAHGFNEGIDNHFSLALPGRDDLFLLNRYGPHWSEMRASDILLIDYDGNVVDGEGDWEITAFMIHRGVHRARPDARCVLHTHMPYATALSMTADGLDTRLGQNAMYFHGKLGRAVYGGLADAAEEGDRLGASVAGGGTVIMLHNHGVIVVGSDAADAWHRLYFLERGADAGARAVDGPAARARPGGGRGAHRRAVGEAVVDAGPAVRRGAAAARPRLTRGTRADGAAARPAATVRRRRRRRAPRTRRPGRRRGRRRGSSRPAPRAARPSRARRPSSPWTARAPRRTSTSTWRRRPGRALVEGLRAAGAAARCSRAPRPSRPTTQASRTSSGRVVERATTARCSRPPASRRACGGTTEAIVHVRRLAIGPGTASALPARRAPPARPAQPRGAPRRDHPPRPVDARRRAARAAVRLRPGAAGADRARARAGALARDRGRRRQRARPAAPDPRRAGARRAEARHRARRAAVPHVARVQRVG